MKNIRYLLSFMVIAPFFISCSIDDGSGGGSQIPPTILANLYATSNTTNTITSYDITTNGVFIRPMESSSNDNEGIYYDDVADELTVVSREQKVINTYRNINDTPSNGDLSLLASGGVLLNSPRDIAVKDNFYIISDNADTDGNPNTDDGTFFIFTKDTNAYTLRNKVKVNYAVWGIELIGNDLYTVVDKTSNVAVLKNFISTYTTDVTATPDKQIVIEGITRTHGITHDGGTVILTDIGDAQSDTDGGFHFIGDFVNRFNAIPDGGTLALAGNQIRVSGPLTEMGNPVAVEYDNSSQTIFISERANGGGKVLFFDQIGAGGNIGPTLSAELPGASSLYFDNK